MERKPISSFQFPPGFRFHPSDEELIVHYLHNKVNSRPLPASVIAEIELYNYNPWDLPKKALFGDEEWYFFSPRDRKYPNGIRPNRTAASGYWKATGTDKPILTSVGSKSIGVKKALVFYTGRPPRGVKTDWIMNEYRLPDTRASRLRGSMRLDDWVLCRVRLKGNMSKNAWAVQENPSKQMGEIPKKIQELPSAYTEANTNMIKNFPFKDWQIIASILASQDLPLFETVASETLQTSDNINNSDSVYNDGLSKGNNQLTASFFETFFNPSKGTPNETCKCNDILPSSKTITNSNGKENFPPGDMQLINLSNIYNQIENEVDFFNLNPSNHSGFTGEL